MNPLIIILIVVLLFGGFGWQHYGYYGGPGVGIGGVVLLLIIAYLLLR